MASGGVNDEENKLRKKLIECLTRQDCQIDGDHLWASDMDDDGGFFSTSVCNIADLAADLILEGVKP